MNRIFQVISAVGLLLVSLPPLFYLAGALEKGPMTTYMLIGTILWFVSAPLWMRRPGEDADPDTAP